MAVIGYHLIWGRGSAAERGALDTGSLPLPYYFYETDSELVKHWDGTAWRECVYADGSTTFTGEIQADAGISIPTGFKLWLDDDENSGFSCEVGDEVTLTLGGTAELLFKVDANGYISIVSLEHGDNLRLYAENAAGAEKVLLQGDPDGSTALAYAGVLVAGTDAAGFAIIGDLLITTGNEVILDTDDDSSWRCSADDIMKGKVGNTDVFTLETTAITFSPGGTDVGFFDADGLDISTRMAKMTYWAPALTSEHITGQYFTDNDASYPAGWDEDDAAASAVTNAYYGLFQVRGTAAETSWQYSYPTGFDLENDAAANEWTSWIFGPIWFRDGGYAADLDYLVGVYGTTAAAMDASKYNRVRLHWDVGDGEWQIRGESNASDGGGETATAYTALGYPPPQPLWIRITIRNTTQTCRNYVGMAYLPLSMTMMSNVAEVAVWGDLYLVLEMDRGAGVNDYLYIGLVDNTSDA